MCNFLNVLEFNLTAPKGAEQRRNEIVSHSRATTAIGAGPTIGRRTEPLDYLSTHFFGPQGSSNKAFGKKAAR
jgi:hypothetical protein